MKIKSAHSFVALATAAAFLSACTSVTYRADASAKPDGFQLSGGYESHIEKTWPLTKKLFSSSGQSQSNSQANPNAGMALLIGIPVAVVCGLIDVFIGWHKQITDTPLELNVEADFVDQRGNPVAGFPVTVGLEGVTQADFTTDGRGRASGTLTAAAPQALPTSTFLKTLSFHFTNNWQAALAEKGEAVEISPESVQIFLNCKSAACHLESQEHKALKDLTFHVQRIEHVDQVQKDAYAKKLADAAQAAREEEARQEEEAKRARAEEAAEAARVVRLRKRVSEDRVAFSSYAEAESVLAPFIEDHTGGQNVWAFAQNPMSYKGKIIRVSMKVFQVAGYGQLLLQAGFPIGSGGPNTLCMGTVSSQFKNPPDIIDGQSLVVLGEIEGATSYSTTMGSNKTVPSMKIYAFQVLSGGMGQ